MIINMQDQVPIRFGLSGIEEIEQNIRMILSTMQGTVPLNRGFGLDSSIIDEPILIARARLTGEVITKLQLYEPRIKVTKVDFADDQSSGRLTPIVHYELVGR